MIGRALACIRDPDFGCLSWRSSRLFLTRTLRALEASRRGPKPTGFIAVADGKTRPGLDPWSAWISFRRGLCDLVGGQPRLLVLARGRRCSRLPRQNYRIIQKSFEGQRLNASAGGCRPVGSSWWLLARFCCSGACLGSSIATMARSSCSARRCALDHPWKRAAAGAPCGRMLRCARQGAP